MIKTALITGASSGIGREFAKLFAADNYNLVLVARGHGGLEKVRDQIHDKHRHVEIRIIERDLSRTENIDELHEILVREKIKVDVLVNNAGFGHLGFFHEENWSRQLGMIQVNIIAVVYLTRLLLPHMISKGEGKILNVASTAAFQPGPMMAIYYATKAFVLYFSEAISNELKGTGVTITTLCPGSTATHFQSVAGIHNTRMIRNGVLPLPKDVAIYGYKAMKKGKRLAVYGLHNKFFIFCVRILPRGIVLRITRLIQDNVKRAY